MAVKGKAATMIAIAAVFGGISIFAADWWINQATNARVDAISASMKPEPAVEFNKIVVAAEPMAFGSPLDPGKLAEIPWPEDAMPEGAFSSIEAVFEKGDRVAVSPIVKNEPVLLSKLSGPDGKAALSNLVEPGMRAVTIKIDEVVGVGGFITPGDRVDVVLTREAETSPGQTAAEALATQVVLENIKVLSVGQDADETSAEPKLVSSATLEVTAEGARKVALARSVGSLTLSLRSPADNAPFDPTVTTVRDFSRSNTDQIKTSATVTVEEIIENAGPRVTTVVVTRGSAQTQTYEVPSN